MKQTFRVEVNRFGIPSAHYVVRDNRDLVVFNDMIAELVKQFDDITSIEWLPLRINDGEVDHD